MAGADQSTQSARFRIRHLLLRPDVIARACLVLWKARLKLKSVRASDIEARNKAASLAFEQQATENQDHAERVRARVALSIPLLARAVPWRSDCLVQAIAAQDWLKTQGISSEIRIGAAPLDQGQLDAHAWLISGGKVITGDNSKEYGVLIGD